LSEANSTTANQQIVVADRNSTTIAFKN
jgi:hypothetical protein